MPTKHKEIDKVLSEWRQGDVVLGKQPFVYVADPNRALTLESKAAKSTGHFQAINKEVDGLVVITQSCDIVRDCKDRPFIEVAPLVKIGERILEEIKNRWRPRYAFIPATAEYFLVGDLDRVMTVEKSVVMSWERTQGCKTSDEARELAKALAHKRGRFAFPDDFLKITEKLVKHIKKKHNKETEEGKFLKALQEIRVQAEPNWEADQVTLYFWFILKSTSGFEVQQWREFHKKYLGMIPREGRFHNASGIVQPLESLTAKDYLGSDQLDFNYLSSSDEQD